MTIGIIGAMPEEVDSILTLLQKMKTYCFGDRIFTQGNFIDQKIVVAFSRWGKVASASTATTMINKFDVQQIIFIGLAGAIDPSLSVGDVIIGDRCIQHDIDARPFFPKYQIPLTASTYLKSSEKLVKIAFNATKRFLLEDLTAAITKEIRHKFQIHQPKAHLGTIASGDQFISCEIKLNNLRKEIDNIKAVEMEGAAVSQICMEFNTPFVVIRTISDKANSGAPVDFNSFLSTVAPSYTLGIMSHFLRGIKLEGD